MHPPRAEDGGLHELPAQINATTGAIVDAAICVHRDLGPGLYEAVYATCLARILVKRGHGVEHQVPVPIHFDGEWIPTGFKIDLLVDGVVMVEVKAVERIAPVHQAQVLTYLKLTGHPVVLLINFDSVPLRNGIFRYVRTAHGPRGYRAARVLDETVGER